MGQAYPELHRAEALITETLKLEEGRFMRTLDRGMQLLREETETLHEGDTLSGETAFKLYDTYGFPLDLTQDALKTRGIAVDTDGFQAAMERQKAEARKAWAGSGEAATDKLWFDLRDELGASEFLGYGTERAEGEITALVKNGKRVKQLRKGDSGVVITNQTPFYGEAGGQVGDKGQIITAKGANLRVDDTQKKLGDLICHYGVVERGPLRVGDQVHMYVDSERRAATRRSHSATHLIHQALRLVLGDHVAQKGSLVEPGRLRFDFSHPKPITDEELRQIEDIANAIVLQNDAVTTRLMSVDEAIEQGALALFGEKYGEEVRVVAMGRAESAHEEKPYSIELCGGTHVARTGDIGLIAIVSESAVSAGVRRIEALTGNAARAYLRERDREVREAAEVLKTQPDELIERIQSLIEERRKLNRELAEARKQLALGGAAAGASGNGAVREVGRVKMLGRTVEGIPPKELRGLVDDGKRQIGSGIVAIVGKGEDGKAGLVVGVTDDLKDEYDAVELVRAGAEALGGKGGGGRRDMAQAGGPDGSRAEEALDAIEERLKQETVGA
jgi:alanyl-tRNA synthetase